ncbi:MAG: energy-coupling factor transporter transmembrane protein EcfT [Polaribacter sp.]|jgi:energy-coupling factor transporter transmembrane protein EcfT
MNKNKSDFIFYLGLVLLLIGTIGLTLLVYFALIGLPIFIVGLILILISKRGLKTKLIPIIPAIGIILSFWFIWTWSNTSKPETFIINQNYRGKVNILYGEKCGKELDIINERLIHNLPDDGILIISNESESGIIDQVYYLIDSNGLKTELPKMDVRDFNEEWNTKKESEPPRDKLGVFHAARMGSSMNSDLEDSYTFQEFYVSTYSDLFGKFNFKYNKRFDSILAAKLKVCRSKN